MKATLTTIITLIFFKTAFSQQVVDIGVLYQPGDSLYGPRFGVATKMPKGWVGGVPEGSGLFIMESINLNDAQIFVRAFPGTLDEITERWNSGFTMARSMDIQPIGEIGRNDNRVSRAFENTQNRNSKMYAVAKCGDYGNCISFFLMSWKGTFEAAKVELIRFAANTDLVEPFKKDIHTGFDWKDFLSNKYVYSYLYDRTQEKSNNVWFCADGTFSMEVKRKGTAMIKDNKKYYGKTYGTWRPSGLGASSVITLDFDKKDLGSFSFDISISSNKIFINGERHFIVNYTGCD